MNINSITFGGRITRDPETTAAGSTTITKFGMVMDNYVSKDRKDPVFVSVVMFGSRGETIQRNVKKGDLFVVTGKLSFSQWEDKSSGSSRSKHEIIANDFSFVGGSSDDAPASEPKAKSKKAPF